MQHILSYCPHTAQKMEFSIKDFFNKCDQFRRKLQKFTEEILNGKLHFLCSGIFIHSTKKIFQYGIIYSGISDHQLIFCTRKINLVEFNKHDNMLLRSLNSFMTEVLITKKPVRSGLIGKLLI